MRKKRGSWDKVDIKEANKNNTSMKISHEEIVNSSPASMSYGGILRSVQIDPDLNQKQMLGIKKWVERCDAWWTVWDLYSMQGRRLSITLFEQVKMLALQETSTANRRKA